MKKFLFVLMAVCFTFAMISCGGGSSSTVTDDREDINVIFFYNDDRDEEGEGYFQAKTIKDGDAIGTLPTPSVLEGEDLEFQGWFLSVLGTGKVSASTKFSVDDGIVEEVDGDYVVALFAYWGEPGKATVRFYSNFAGSTLEPIEIGPFNNGIIGSAGLPDTTASGDWYRGDWVFGGWYDNPEGAGTAYNLSSNQFSGRTELFAKWTLNMDGIIERVTLRNAMMVPYQFTLPPTKTWSDYDGVWVDYLLDQATITSGIARSIRLYGNYTMNDFNFAEGTGDALGNNQAVLNWDNLPNADYIMNQKIADSSNLGTAISGFAEMNSQPPKADTWFTLKHPTDGTGANAAFKNMPTNNATGPFVLGVGLPGGSDAQTALIRNVTLKGKTAADTDVVGTPIVFKATYEGVERLYPAFIGYVNPSGTDGWKEAKREEIGNTKTAAIQHTFVTYTVTLNYNYPEGVLGQPANGSVTTSRDLTLSSTQLFASLPGYKLTWSTTASGAGTAVTTATKFANNTTTIYARWELLPSPTGPVFDTTFTDSNLKTQGSNLTYEDSNDVVWSVMTKTSYGTLLTYKFPASVASYNYTSVKVTFQVSKNYDGYVATPGTKLVTSLRNGFEQWGDALDLSKVGEAQKTFPEFAQVGTTDPWTVEHTWPMSLFTHSSGGLGLAYKDDDPATADKWLLRITKVEFHNADVTYTPAVAYFDVNNLSQDIKTNASVAVTVAHKSTSTNQGAISNIQYAGSSTLPTTKGIYPVTFDVAADTTNKWAAGTSVAAGNLRLYNSDDVFNPEIDVATVTITTAGTVSGVSIAANVVTLVEPTSGEGFVYDFSDLVGDLALGDYTKVEITLDIAIDSTATLKFNLTTKKNTDFSALVDLQNAAHDNYSQYINNLGNNFGAGDDAEVTRTYLLADCENNLILWQLGGGAVEGATVTITGIKFLAD